jgi:hypothetical protein
MNRLVIEASRKLKVHTTDPAHHGGEAAKASEGVVDKRPRKERELDIYSEEFKLDLDLRMYGYLKPERVQAGRLTLRQFDELLKEQDEAKSAPGETIKAATERLNLKPEDVHNLLHYYKTFAVISNATTKKENEPIANVFPNINNDKKLSA